MPSPNGMQQHRETRDEHVHCTTLERAVSAPVFLSWCRKSPFQSFQIPNSINSKCPAHNTQHSEGEASHAILFYSKITSASSSSTSSVSDASPYRYRSSFGSERRGLVDFGECLPRPHSPGREACAEPQPSWWRGLGRVISSIAMDLRLLLPVLRALLPSK